MLLVDWLILLKTGSFPTRLQLNYKMALFVYIFPSLQYNHCPPGWISMSPSLGCILYHTEACGGVQQGGCDWIQVFSVPRYFIQYLYY